MDGTQVMAIKQQASIEKPTSYADGLPANDPHVAHEAERERLLREAQQARAEAELERQRFRRLFLQAPAPVVLLRGPQHVVELANPPALEIWGRSEDDVVGKPLLDALPEVRDQGIKELLDRVFTTGQAHFGTELKVQLDRRGDGTLEDVYFTFVYEPMRDELGTVEGVMVLAFIVTDQVLARHKAEAAESALHQQQEQLRIALAASGTGTFRWDPLTDAYLTFDANLKRLFGFSPEDPVQFTEDKLARVHPDDVEALRAAIQRRRQRADFEMDYRVILPDGSVRWLHDRGKMEHDAAGRPTYLVGACTDITQRKQSELAAHEAAEHLRFLAEMVPQKVFTATPTGEVDYFNPQWMSYTGLSFEQIRDWGWTQFIHPEDVAENVRVWRQSVATGEPFQFEHRFRRADGTYRWHLSRALPMKDEQGQVVKWFGANTDIDDQKRAVQQKDEFVSVAAHELRSPVTTLKGQIQLLRRRLRKRGETAVAAELTKLDIQLDRLTQRIGELLDMSRLQEGQLPLQFDSIDVDALLAEVVETVQATSPTHQIAIERATRQRIWGDRERIGQVITNLLTNAIKYSPEANRVVVHATANEREIALGVQDFGIGVALDEQRKIFERFYRVTDSALGTVTGWGLGLYISAEIVRRHGGRMNVESTPGAGATFWIHLPIESVETSHTPPPPTAA